jgi:hypothetical protein
MKLLIFASFRENVEIPEMRAPLAGVAAARGELFRRSPSIAKAAKTTFPSDIAIPRLGDLPREGLSFVRMSHR